MDYAEISVDPKFHRHLIGKGGANSEYHAVFFFFFFLPHLIYIQACTSHALG